VTVDGGTKGVPFAFSCPVLYTNDDLIAAAGVDPAALLATWSSVLEQGGPIKDSSTYPVLGFSTNRDWPAQSIIQSNGGMVVNDAGELAFDTPEAIEALKAITALNDAGLYYNATTTEIRPSFVAGALGVMQSSIASLGGLSKEVTFKMSVHPFPTFGDKPRKMNSGGSFIGVYARDDEQKAATWDFLKFVVSEEGMNIWMQTGYLNATTFDIPQLPGQEAAYLQLSEGLTRETAWPGSRGAEMQKLWEDYVVRIWTGDISAEDGVEEAKQELSALIA
jgi:multiple sugar transport system substrate-binding protein